MSLEQRGILSIPKSGRTWIRLFIHTYFKRLDRSLPHIPFAHKIEYLDFDKNKKSKCLILLRNPFDVIVSRYLAVKIGKGKDVDLKAFIKSKKLGIHMMNRELEAFSRYDGDFKVITYDQLFLPIWREILSYFELPIEETVIDEVDEFCKIDNIRANLDQLKSYPDWWRYAARENKRYTLEPKNPEAHKFRKGISGGFKDYLNDEQIGIIRTNYKWELADSLCNGNLLV